MIHLLDIEITDFMSIEHLQMNFSANETKMISGENGAGKSALFNAIALVWIEYRKGESYKDFIRVGCETAHIIHNAIFDGEPIHFDITISNDKYATPLIRKIEYLGRTYNNSECTALFKTFDMEHLEHIMFLFQRDNSIVDLKAGERAKLLKRLFHFEFEAQVQELKARLLTEQTSYHDNSIRLEELSKREFREQEILPVASEEEKLAAIDSIKAIDVKLAELGSLDSSQLKDTQIALQDARDHVAAQGIVEKKLREDIQHLAKQLSDIEALTLPSPPEMMDTTSLRDELTLTDNTLVQLQYAVQTHTKEIADLELYTSIATEGRCHVCGSAVDARTVEKLKSDLEIAKRELESARQGQQQYQRFRNTQLTILNKKEDEIKQYRAEVQNVNWRKSTAAGIRELLAAKENSLAMELRALQGYMERVAYLEAQLSMLGSLEAQILECDKLLQDKASLQEWLEERNRCIAINDERIAANRRLIEEKSAHDMLLRDIAQSISEAAGSIETLKNAISVLETDFPNFIILQTCGQIEGYINDVVQRVFPYMQVTLKPNRGGVEFYYTVDYTTNRWLSVKMASGAQAAILSLAWRVAIAKLYGVTTILLDEIDADCTDENSKLLYEFVASLDMFHQIILISHRKEALRAVAALADNVTCYWVTSGGNYLEVADPDSI